MPEDSDGLSEPYTGVESKQVGRLNPPFSSVASRLGVGDFPGSLTVHWDRLILCSAAARE